jgi:hypothetical protein
MEHPTRDFKGIWIPKDIWLSPALSLMEKVLFVEIHSLDNERGCYASNRYFANFFGMSDRQIRRYIGTLKEKGLISVEMRSETERVIHVRGKYSRPTETDFRVLNEMRASLSRRMSVRK